MRKFMLSILLFGLLAVPATAQTVLYDFYADWCQPCKAMAPAVDSLARDGYVVQRVNIDQDRELAARFGVKSLPTFIVVERGREVDRVTGLTTIERLKTKMRRRPARVQKEKTKTKTRPTPAWRYEHAIGHRATVVRVLCHDGGPMWSKGSGVYVRYGKRLVILTARHVVKDAKQIYIQFHNRKRYKARVLKVDARWDCAVLSIDVEPNGIKPAEMAFGNDAKFDGNSRLESCGYGSDDQLAVNEGLFQGYRKTSATPNGPDDWMVISGHARQGDSGGPVFDKEGRVVGVLWGTDGSTVVCVQPGRIHLMLNEVLVEKLAYHERRPTPPVDAPLVPVEWKQPTDQTGLRQGEKAPMLPWRKDAVDDQKAQDARIEALIRLAEANANGQPSTNVGVQVGPQHPKPPAEAQRSPIASAAVILFGIIGGFVIYFAMLKK